MDVADVMTRASVADSATATVRAAASLMWAQQTGSLIVMDGVDLVGIVTERDVLKAVARGLDVADLPVSVVMTRDVVTVSPDTSVYAAARLMAARWIRHLPVVADRDVVGMVSQRDLVGILAALDNDPDAVHLAADELVHDQRLVHIEPGDLD